MLGSKERAFDPLSPVTLEELVPAGHFSRSRVAVLMAW
jgi:hypothetical protein